MKKLRILILVFFLIVFSVFSFERIQEYIMSDYTAPVITAAEDSLQVSVSARDAELLAGMSASDNLDGDVTDTLMVVSKTKFVSKGTLRVNYAAFDKNNNVGTYSRMLTYTDYHSPRFSMSQPLRFVSGNSKYDYLDNISAQDCLDGNITQQVKITFGETVSTSATSSSQQVHLQVTNSAGDTSVLELTATFEDYASYSQPSPALSEYIIYLKPGERPDYSSYLTGVWTSGKVKSFEDMRFDRYSDVRVDDGSVNYNAPGVYTVSYQLRRAAGDGSGTTDSYGTATLYVVVEE